MAVSSASNLASAAFMASPLPTGAAGGGLDGAEPPWLCAGFAGACADTVPDKVTLPNRSVLAIR